MIKSMTGFGKGENKDHSRHFTVEIKSVNNRYNDIIVKMPKYLKSIEEKVKKLIKTKVNRGRVDVYINLEYIGESDLEVKVDLKLATSYAKALEALSKVTGKDMDLTLDIMTKFPELITTEKKEEDENEIWECLKVAVEEALEKMIAMRTSEGQELAKDVSNRIRVIEDKINIITKRVPEIVAEYKGRLWERINELLDDKYDLDENRLINEVAIFADKSDINEELVRLSSHINQLRETLKSQDSVGRKLDFILQEANREINTIGSKVGDVDITNHVIEIKSELEKVREQAQNIE